MLDMKSVLKSWQAAISSWQSDSLQPTTYGLLLAAHCLLSTALYAQTDSTLTYEQAVNIALRENIQIQQQRNLLSINQAERTQAFAQYLPNAGAGVNAQRSFGRQFDQTTGVFTSQEANRASGYLSASYIIFNGLERYHRLRQTKNALEAQIQQVAQAKQDVVFNVSQQYLEVLLNQELLRIARANLKQQEELLESVTTFVSSGIRNIADQYNQEAESKRAALQVVETENALAISKAALIRTLQIDPFKSWQFTEPNVKQAEILIRQTDLGAAYNQAIANRPDLKQLQHQVAVNQREIKIARTGYLPRLSFNYFYYSRYSSLDSIGDPGEKVLRPFRDQVFELNPVQELELSLYIPIFDRLEANTNIQRSRQLLNNAQLDVEDLQRGILEQLQTVVADYRAAQERILATDAQVKAAEKALEAEKERFRLGVGSILDVNRVNALYVEAQANKAQATYTLIFQKTAMDYYTGTLEPEQF